MLYEQTMIDRGPGAEPVYVTTEIHDDHITSMITDREGVEIERHNNWTIRHGTTSAAWMHTLSCERARKVNMLEVER